MRGSGPARTPAALFEGFHDGRTPLGLHHDEARLLLVEPADGAELVERLPHSDEPTPPPSDRRSRRAGATRAAPRARIPSSSYFDAIGSRRVDASNQRGQRTPSSRRARVRDRSRHEVTSAPYAEVSRMITSGVVSGITTTTRITARARTGPRRTGVPGGRQRERFDAQLDRSRHTTAAPRALNDPVGSRPSSFTRSRGMAIFSPSDGVSSSGVSSRRGSRRGAGSSWAGARDSAIASRADRGARLS